MSSDATPDLLSPDPSTRAEALIERAIESIKSAEDASATADLDEAERIAREAGIPELLASVLINRGYHRSVREQSERASELYAEAADVAREAGDTERLALALGNLSVELDTQGRHADVIAALDEYLSLIDEEQVEPRARALMSRGLAHLDNGDMDGALVDLGEAERIAREANAGELTYQARMNLGHAYNRNDDLQTAQIIYDQAALVARQLGNEDYLRDVLVILAQLSHFSGHNYVARTHFAEVEPMCRKADDPALLAHILYWYGGTLRRDRRGERCSSRRAPRRLPAHDGRRAEEARRARSRRSSLHRGRGDLRPCRRE